MKKYPRFADPTVDFVFKKIFGTEQYKAATIGLINSLLLDRQVEDLSFINVEISGPCKEDRKSCVDVLCKDASDGSTFILEMQVVRQEYFRQRTVLYAASVIVHDAEKGDGWDYHVKPMYVISVLGFDLPHTPEEKAAGKYITHYRTIDDTTGKSLPGAPEYFFLEPLRFDKKIGELADYQEKWLYLFHNTMNLEIIPDEFGDDNSFQAWFKASETANFTKDERIEYDKIMMTKTDIRYGMELRYKEGHAAGVAEGHAAGVAEGMEKGHAAGVAEGSAAAKLEMAKAMLAKGISAEVIADCSGLTIQQIQSL